MRMNNIDALRVNKPSQARERQRRETSLWNFHKLLTMLAKERSEWTLLRRCDEKSNLARLEAAKKVEHVSRAASEI